MHYIRTFAGAMMPISFKTNSLVADKKQTTVTKPAKKSKKALAFESK